MVRGPVITLRPPVLDDAPAALAVLVARDLADLGAAIHQLPALVSEWRGPDLELAADTVVADVAGQLVGYAAVRRQGSMVVVAPDHEGRGIGTRLRHWTEMQERARGQAHRQWIAAENTSGRTLLLGAGYHLTRSYLRMARGLTAGPGRSHGATDVAVRRLDIAADAARLHELDAESFASVPDYEPESLETFRREHLHAPDIDPSLSFVAERGGAAAGFLLARRWDEPAVGFVDLLAVHPDHQRRGVGRALLERAFAAFTAAGLTEAQLSVAGDNPPALALYAQVGLAPRFRFATYERGAGSLV